MTIPLSSGRPGRSQMSHGKGMMAHPDSDAQSVRNLPWQTESDKHDATNRIRAELRSDPTNSAEVIIPDLYYAKGNPDIFGPAPAMVQEAAYTPPPTYKQPVLRYGVDRQE
jgi:hypothetical protein